MILSQSVENARAIKLVKSGTAMPTARKAFFWNPNPNGRGGRRMRQTIGSRSVSTSSSKYVGVEQS